MPFLEFIDKSKTNTESYIHYVCSNCQIVKKVMLRAWLQKLKIKNMKDYNSEKPDLCRSCTVKRIHADTDKAEIKRKMDKARSSTLAAIKTDIGYWTCLVCDKMMVDRSHVAKNKKFCKKCVKGQNWLNQLPESVRGKYIEKMKIRSTGNKNIMYGRLAKHGKITRIKLANVLYYFRSKWEASYAVYLFKNNKDFLYEPESFVISDGATYRPDFYVGGKWIEVKGFWRDDAKEKFDIFCDIVGKENVELVQIKELSNFIGFNPKNESKMNEFLSPFICGDENEV